jgi:hypothetical protein
VIATKDGWKRTLTLPTGATFEQMLEFFGIPPYPADQLTQNIRAKRRTWHHMANSANPVGRAKANEVETLIQRLSQTLLRGDLWDPDGGATVEIPKPVFETPDELWRIVTEHVFAADYDQALQVAREAGSHLTETADAASVLAWVLATGFNTENLINPALLAEGLEAADSAVRGQPHVARNWESKVSLLIAGYRVQDALVALEEATKAVTGHVTARLHIMRAKVVAALGRPEEAMVAAVRAVNTALADGDDVPAIRSEATDLLLAWMSANLLPIKSSADLERYAEMVGVAAWCSDGVPDAEDQVRDSDQAAAGNGNAHGRDGGGHRGSDDGGQHYEDGSQPRFLTGILPERVPVDARISLLVQITLAAAQRASTALESIPASRSGNTVTITVSAPALSPLGDLEQDLTVPPNADSRPVRFGFIAREAGLHTVQVRAFIGGTCLGELALQISIQPVAALEEGRPRTTPITGLTAEPGEVTLQVSRTAGGGYSFQLLSEALYPMVLIDRLAGNPATVVEQIVAELRAMSKGQSQFSTSALVRKRLRSLGARLWADVVPATIREQFWAQRDRIRQFTIASDLDTVPWELLYPVDLANEAGFLVEQFPVVRRVYGQGRARILRVNKGVGFIVPPRSPTNAMAEVTAVRSVLPPDMEYRGTEAGLAEVLELLDAVPSVLHFAGHNAFTDEIGSMISLDGGPLRPDDLYPAKQKRAFGNVSPLVFFNGCRTAGEIPGFTQMNGWAHEFMGAGAAAFIGSLWAVRSSSAVVFAKEFYRELVRDRQPLGVASQHARQVIAADESDPTWLAYAVYGNPSATVEDSPHRNL